jgi:hypothetical protein
MALRETGMPGLIMQSITLKVTRASTFWAESPRLPVDQNFVA